MTHINIDLSWYTTQLKKNKLSYDITIFDNEYFESIKTYSKLLLSKQFYIRYLKYDYMLIYQLDAYIFTDELDKWLNKKLSYIGAPWFICKNDNISYDGIGNGGFSLRHIKTHLNVIRSLGKLDPIFLYVRYCFQKGIGPSLLMKHVLFRCNKHYYKIFKEHKGNEDVFWCKVAAYKFKWFSLPSLSEALEFSFETEPHYAYKLNNYQLPFGCHAWEKYDFKFWQKFIS